jgi:anti-sigma B factor antagonist
MPEESASRLTVEIDRGPDLVLVRCRGKLVAGVNDFLYGKVRELMPGSQRIVLDLTDLTHMDSMGLGTIVRLYVTAKATGCGLELVNVGPRIQQVLGISNLLSIFTTVGESHIRM